MDDRDSGKAADCQEGADQEDFMDSDESPSGQPTTENGDWRTTLKPDSRERIVNKIMDTLKRHLPFSGQEGLNELRKIAVRFEEKIFTGASSQSDYLRRISLKMLTMETKSQNTMPNTGNNSKPPYPGSQGMQNQVHSQGQTIPVTLESNQSQACQQLLLQSIPNNMISAGVQSSAGLQSGMPPVSSLSQDPISSVGQNSNMQNMSGISQNSTGQGMPSNIFANQQRQMQGRQQVLPQQQQQLYHQQLQQQLMKQKIQQGNLQPSLAQSHMQQQQQQNLLPPMQLQSSQQFGMQTSSVMQPSNMQSTPLPGLQQNQKSSLQQSTQSMLQQHQPQQTASSGINQQQTPMTQQPIISQMQSLSTQLQQQLGLQQQPNQVQQSMQQRLQASGQPLNTLLQSQNLIDQQKQLCHSPKAVLETSSTSLGSTAQTGHANGGDWQEEIYQKIKSMKDAYLPELNEMHQKISAKLLQHDSLPQHQLDKLKIFKTMLERIAHFLRSSKASIGPAYKEKINLYEKQIINFIDANRPRKPVSALQQGLLPPPQTNETQSDDNQMNPQLGSINLQGSMPTMQLNNMISLQHNSYSSLPLVSTAPQTTVNLPQPGSNLVPAQGSAPGALQGCPVSTSRQPNISSLPSQSGLNVLQRNMNPQLVPFPQTIQMNTQLPSMMPFALTPQTIQLYQCQMMQIQRQQQLMLRHMQQQQMLLQQYLNQLAGQQSPAKIKTDELPQSHQMDIDAGNGMSTMSILPLLPESKEANALTTDVGKPNIIEQPHDPMVNMAKGKPMPPELLNATVVNMVDEASIAVGEDLAAMRKRGLTGAERMRCYLSALVILALILFFISNVNHQY